VTKTKLYITSQQNRLALECRLSALADILHSFADAVYQQLGTFFFSQENHHFVIKTLPSNLLQLMLSAPSIKTRQ